MSSKFAGMPFRSVVLTCALAFAAGLVPTSAAAQSETSPLDDDSLTLRPPFSPEGSRPPPPLRPPVASRPPPPEPAVHFVGIMGYDRGGKKLVAATLSDGSTESVSARQGLDFSVGVAFLKAVGGRLATQATIGIQGWSITADDGSVQWLTFPLDVMEFVYLDRVRLGAGLSYLINPRLWGTGAASGLGEHRFKNSLGLALEGDWVWARRDARHARVTAGGRWVSQKLQERGGGPLIDASSFAILIGYTG